MKHFFTLGFLLALLPAFSQNLIVNPSADNGDPIGNGWTAVAAGTACYTGGNWRITGNQNGFPTSQAGAQYFYSGCGGASGEIYQDIDVSADATDIDNNLAEYSFTGYTQSYNQTPADDANITVEYRDAANTTVLDSYTTGATANIDSWSMYSDTRTAPVGTRHIRIRLISTANNGDSVDGYFDELSLTYSLLLPIELERFFAQNKNGKVEINWTTATETDNDYFTVERSIDAHSWESIGMVEGAGNSIEALNYSFSDPKPKRGVSFYRLKQTDYNGDFTYSAVSSVNIAGETGDAAQVFPNPATNTFNIDLKSEELTQVSFYGIGGQLVFQNLELEAGQHTIDTQDLPRGVYFLQIKTGNQLENVKVILD